MPATADPEKAPSCALLLADALRLVLETALDAVIVMRDDGVVADWNHYAVTIFGWTMAEPSNSEASNQSAPQARDGEMDCVGQAILGLLNTAAGKAETDMRQALRAADLRVFGRSLTGGPQSRLKSSKLQLYREKTERAEGS
jgi:hypothetical protein